MNPFTCSYTGWKSEGNDKTWYRNGFIRSRKVLYCFSAPYEFYQNGKIEGEYKEWYEDGTPLEHKLYKKGKLEGKHKLWYDNGQLYILWHHRDGNIITIKRYSRDGTIIRNSLYFAETVFIDFPRKSERAFLRNRLHPRYSLFNIDAYLIPDLSNII
jgi:hypothetical protein